jgi:uncharacterized membrane protein HdeD (DUF308 family)
MIRNWWAFILRGAIAVIFGILAFFWPGITIAALVFLFGFYVLLDGIFAVYSAIRALGKGQSWFFLVIEGILGIVAGIITIVWPAITALVLVFIIGFWAILTGVMEIMTAIRLRREITNEWALGIAGAISIIFGIIMLIWPGSALLSFAWLIGLFAILFGISFIAIGWRFKGLNDQRNGKGRLTPAA